MYQNPMGMSTCFCLKSDESLHKHTSHFRFVVERESENINDAQKFEVSFLHINNVSLDHVGEYKCYATNKSDLDFAKKEINVTLPPKVAQISKRIKTKLHNNVELYCIISGYPTPAITWYQDDKKLDTKLYETKTLNDTHYITTLQLNGITNKYNGTYVCEGNTARGSSKGVTDVLVLNKPEVTLDTVKAIGRTKIYLNWTVNDGNDPEHINYNIQYMVAGSTTWYYYRNAIEKDANSLVMSDFKPNTTYVLKIKASNEEGESVVSESLPVRTLLEDPQFEPEVKVTGVAMISITISWTEPPKELADYVQYYTLKLFNSDNTSVPLETIVPVSIKYHMFVDLAPATTYNFQVKACCEYSKECGPWSKVVNGTTMDGFAGPVSNASVECKFENISHTSCIHVSWKPPLNPHGTIVSYNVNLEGSATFINDKGVLENTTWGPKAKSISESTLSTRFYNVSANTNYTITVSAVTRTKKYGEKVELYCMMPPTVPDKQKLSRFNWRKIEEQGRWVFKLFMPRISERNGPICCYRIYLVRMEAQQKLAELPAPEELEIVSYRQAHRTPKGGAYVAEMFTR